MKLKNYVEKPKMVLAFTNIWSLFLKLLVWKSDKIYRNYLLVILEPKIQNPFFVFQALQENEVRGAEEENLVSLSFSSSVSFKFCFGSHICAS